MIEAWIEGGTYADLAVWAKRQEAGLTACEADKAAVRAVRE